MSNEGSTTFRAQLFPVLLVMGVLFANMLPRSAFSPLLISIERSLGVSHAAAASLFLYLSLGAAVSMALSGLLSSRLMHRYVISLSAALASVSLVALSTTGSFAGLAVGLTIFGMGTGLYPPSGMATITSLVDRRDWGKALALHELGPNLARWPRRCWWGF